MVAVTAVVLLQEWWQLPQYTWPEPLEMTGQYENEPLQAAWCLL